MYNHTIKNISLNVLLVTHLSIKKTERYIFRGMKNSSKNVQKLITASAEENSSKHMSLHRQRPLASSLQKPNENPQTTENTQPKLTDTPKEKEFYTPNPKLDQSLAVQWGPKIPNSEKPTESYEEFIKNIQNASIIEQRHKTPQDILQEVCENVDKKGPAEMDTKLKKYIEELPIIPYKYTREKTETVSHLTIKSPIKPSAMLEKQHHQLALLQTIKECSDKGLPFDQLLVHAVFTEGNSGENLTLIEQHFGYYVKKQQGDANVEKFLTEEEKLELPDHVRDAIAGSNAVIGCRTVGEIKAVSKTNASSLTRHKLYITGDMDPLGTGLISENYYNFGKNKAPDTLQIHPPISDNMTYQGRDVKMTGSPEYQTKNILQCSSQNIEQSTKQAHIHLQRTIQNKLWAQQISDADRNLATAIQHHANANWQMYREGKQELDSCVRNLNQFSELYTDFLYNNQIGLNMQVEVTSKDFSSIDPQVREEFDKLYYNNRTSENSKVHEYAQKHYSTGPVSPETHNDILCSIFGTGI